MTTPEKRFPAPKCPSCAKETKFATWCDECLKKWKQGKLPWKNTREAMSK